MVTNLLRNATVHTPAKTLIEVSVARDGDFAVLKVSDHGPGVAPDVGARIFERFVRADPARGARWATSRSCRAGGLVFPLQALTPVEGSPAFDH